MSERKERKRDKKETNGKTSAERRPSMGNRLTQKMVLDDDSDVVALLIQAFSAHRICKHVRINRAFFRKLTSEQSSFLLEAIGELPKLEIFEIDFPPREGHPLIAHALAVFLKKAKKLHTITLCNLELSGETDVMIDALNNHPSLQDVKILLLQEGVPHLIHSWAASRMNYSGSNIIKNVLLVRIWSAPQPSGLPTEEDRENDVR